MTKATSIGDVLAVQAELDTLQSQIEQLQGQLAVLDSETDYSTMTIAVSEPRTGTTTRRPPAPVRADQAWHDSVHGFVAGVEGTHPHCRPGSLRSALPGAGLARRSALWRR